MLIHNAGVYGSGMSVEVVNRINAEGPFEVVEALMGAVQRSEQRKIGLITSQMGARHGSAGASASTATRRRRSTTASGRWSGTGGRRAASRW